MMLALRAAAIATCALTGIVSGCAHDPAGPTAASKTSASEPVEHDAAAPVPWQFRNPLPGMPPVIANDVYSQTRAGMVRPDLATDPAYLYVPDSKGTTVTVIDQRSRKIVRVLQAGFLSQHVVPTYDLLR